MLKVAALKTFVVYCARSKIFCCVVYVIPQHLSFVVGLPYKNFCWLMYARHYILHLQLKCVINKSSRSTGEGSTFSVNTCTYLNIFRVLPRALSTILLGLLSRVLILVTPVPYFIKYFWFVGLLVHILVSCVYLLLEYFDQVLVQTIDGMLFISMFLPTFAFCFCLRGFVCEGRTICMDLFSSICLHR